MKNSHQIITIDGPAGSGKSTTARKVAEKLGWIYLDTGAMYRAMAVKVLRTKIPLDDSEAIGQVAEITSIFLVPSKDGTRVFLDGTDISDEIRKPDVDRAVGPVCEVPKVRELLVSLQQRLAQNGHVVAEGRDMATVVFPDAEFQFFMVATPDVRAKRRHKELEQHGIRLALEDVRKEIERRDKRDSHRTISPLLKTDRSILIDTSDLSIEEQVDRIVGIVKDREKTL